MSGFGQDRRPSTPSASPVSIFGGSEASASGLMEPLGERRASVPSTPIFRPVDLPSLENHEEHTRELQKKVSHLTRTMHHNLQYVLKRGSNLTDLEKRLGTLELESKSFQRSAGKVDKKLWGMGRGHFDTLDSGVPDLKARNILLNVFSLLKASPALIGLVFLRRDSMGGEYRRHHRGRSRSPIPSRSSTVPSRRDHDKEGQRMPDNESERRSYRDRDHHDLSRGREALPQRGYGDGHRSQALGRDARRRDKSSERQNKDRMSSSALAHTLTTIDVSNVDPDDEDSIMKAMGFGGFDTTKGKHVPGNIHGAVDKRKKLEYRQYLHKKKLYDVPLTRQQLEERGHQTASTNKEDS